MRSPLLRRYLTAGLASAGFVAIVDLLTNRMPPLWDAHQYIGIAENGWLGNEELLAPYAYRPGMPLLARGAAWLFSVDVGTGFLIVAYVSMIALLMLSFAFATRLGLRSPTAAFVAATVGVSAFHVKIPLFLPFMVDVSSYPILVFAVLAFLEGRTRTTLVTSWIGLAFKEFLIIPVVLLLGRWVGGLREPGSPRRWALALVATAVTTLIVLLPRVLIPVVDTHQEIDPINDPASLKGLYEHPLKAKRLLNFVFVYVSYWLPTLLLLTRERLRRLWSDLGELRGVVVTCLVLCFILTMYGGTDLLKFSSYSVAAQLICLSVLLRQQVGREEKAFVLVALVVYNRLWMKIPLPEVDLDAYLDFYGGWGSRRLPLGRVAELLAYFAGIHLMRKIRRARGVA